jgi:hypothetical protein
VTSSAGRPGLPHGVAELRLWWEPEGYFINWDFRAQVFRASRGASVLEAKDPAELWVLIRRDFAMNPGEPE